LKFYLGVHHPNWLWSGDMDCRLFVSHARLRTRKTPFPRAIVPEWALDSMGFTMLRDNGRWTVSPRMYAEYVLRYDAEIGRLAWAAPQDRMCERPIIDGGVVDGQVYTGTRQFLDPLGHLSYEQLVTEHQKETVLNFKELEEIWREFRRVGKASRNSPFKPTLQGIPGDPESYLDCAQMYEDAGVRLSDYSLVGVGSVCRIQAEPLIGHLARGLAELNLPFHWFGLKLAGIPEVWPTIASSDSQAWGVHARRDPRLEGCTHVRVRGKYVGQPSTCANCPRYARLWHGKVISLISSLEARDLEAAS
jgi:hypothetical protein